MQALPRGDRLPYYNDHRYYLNWTTHSFLETTDFHLSHVEKFSSAKIPFVDWVVVKEPWRTVF